MVQDESGNLIKYIKDGQFIWIIESETSPGTFCIDSSDLLYCATGDKVKVYLLVSGLNDPIGIAIDGDNNIHVGIFSVFCINTSLKTVYQSQEAKNFLQKTKRI